MKPNAISTQSGFVEAIVWRILLTAQDLVTCLFKSPKQERAGFGSKAHAFRGPHTSDADLLEEVLDLESDLRPPHKVQVCGLTKSEAEDLLDCLENVKGPYLFVDCSLEANGFVVSFLTRRWRPQKPVRSKPDPRGPASQKPGLPRRMSETDFKIKLEGTRV
jgi:hypothetical protein